MGELQESTLDVVSAMIAQKNLLDAQAGSDWSEQCVLAAKMLERITVLGNGHGDVCHGCLDVHECHALPPVFVAWSLEGSAILKARL